MVPVQNPLTGFRTDISAWLARPDSGADQMIRWMQGYDLPAVGHEEEPWCWVDRMVTDPIDRRNLAQRISTILTEWKHGHTTGWRVRRIEQVLYNLLALTQALREPSATGEVLRACRNNPVQGSWRAVRLASVARDAWEANVEVAVAIVREASHEARTRIEFRGHLPQWIVAFADELVRTADSEEWPDWQVQSLPFPAMMDDALVFWRPLGELLQAAHFTPVRELCGGEVQLFTGLPPESLAELESAREKVDERRNEFPYQSPRACQGDALELIKDLAEPVIVSLGAGDSQEQIKAFKERQHAALSLAAYA